MDDRAAQETRIRRSRRTPLVATAASVLAVLWGGFWILGVELDLFYTQDWFYAIDDPTHREAATRFILGRLALVAVPLVVTNVWCALLIWSSLARASDQS